nr:MULTISPECIES: leucyl/phenylalanyl-tRNA--protein transferase [Psychrobacter]
MLSRFAFPDPKLADPDGTGFVALGGDLAPDTLIAAYAQGLFPWFNEGEPQAWWCPEPRCIIVPSKYCPSKSLKKQAKASRWRLTLNHAFAEVIQACSLPRSYSPTDGDHSWIHQTMIDAYQALHHVGFAHSLEVWDDDNVLIGGLYGVKIGQIYFGESMFHQQANASKLAFWGLIKLCQQSGVALVDCQLPNPHLMSLGAVTMPRAEFLTQLPKLIEGVNAHWQAANYQPLPVSRLIAAQPWQSTPN